MRYARLILLIAPERLREIESHLQPGENRQEFIRRAVDERIKRLTTKAPDGAQREEGKMKKTLDGQTIKVSDTFWSVAKEWIFSPGPAGGKKWVTPVVADDRTKLIRMKTMSFSDGSEDVSYYVDDTIE